jgi:hypothetical protein
MKRRSFLSSSLPASALAACSATGYLKGNQQSTDGKSRQYYALRRYELHTGAQHKITDTYLSEALVPGLNRLGIKQVGVFTPDVGPQSPSAYVLLPADSADDLVNVDFRLEKDAEYMKAAEAFWKAPADHPPFIRMESSLMVAFEGYPRLTVPPVTASHGERVFELRTYESATDQDHRRKVEMFNSGEFGVFQRAGFWEVFYGDTLVGSRMPNLTYMIGFPNDSDRKKLWKAFGEDPEWKKLTGSSRFNFEEIVSNITNTLLTPTSYSQI